MHQAGGSGRRESARAFLAEHRARRPRRSPPASTAYASCTRVSHPPRCPRLRFCHRQPFHAAGQLARSSICFLVSTAFSETRPAKQRRSDSTPAQRRPPFVGADWALVNCGAAVDWGDTDSCAALQVDFDPLVITIIADPSVNVVGARQPSPACDPAPPAAPSTASVGCAAAPRRFV